MSEIASPDAAGVPATDSDDRATRALIGRGVLFPVETDRQGRLALTRGDDVAASIRMIIMTAPGERVMRPDFGCAVWDNMFSPINAATLGQMAHAVREALSRWEPRIEVTEVRVSPHASLESRVDIAISYELRHTNDSRNLVFPFYVLPKEE